MGTSHVPLQGFGVLQIASYAGYSNDPFAEAVAGEFPFQ